MALEVYFLAALTIVALTASVTAEDQERCRAAGMDDFVAKPTQLKTLRRILGRWG